MFHVCAENNVDLQNVIG